MDLQAEFYYKNFKPQARYLSLRASKTGKSQVEFRYEDFYSEFRGKISLWNLDQNSKAKPQYKILIGISRRHFKTKFRDLNFTQNKIPRFKISRRLTSCFVALIACSSSRYFTCALKICVMLGICAPATSNSAVLICTP